MRQLVLARDWRLEIRRPVLLTGARVLAESEVEVERAERFAGCELFVVVRDVSEQRDVLERDRFALRVENLRRVAKEVGSGVELDGLVAGVAEEDDQRDSFAAAEFSLRLRLRQRDAVLQAELRVAPRRLELVDELSRRLDRKSVV